MDADERPGAGSQTIVAVFETPEDAERALDALRRAGLRREDVSLVMREAPPPSTETEDTMGSSVVTGAATGATVGGLLGGLAGWLLATLVPGVGPVLGAGVLASTLTGAAVGAAGGGILGALLGLGVPEDEAAHYVGQVEAGRILVTVHTTGPAPHGRAMAALAESKAQNVRTYTASGMTAGLAPADDTPLAVAAPPAALDRLVPADETTPLAPVTADSLAPADDAPPGADEARPADAAPPGVVDRRAADDVPPAAPGAADSRAAADDDTPLRIMAAEAPAPPARPVVAPPVVTAIGARRPGVDNEGDPGRVTGDVAAAEGGGPDVRGALGQGTSANRDLTDALEDVAEWRSGGEQVRPGAAPPSAERGLDVPGDSAAPGETPALPPPSSGDVLAVTIGGPDVRPPGMDAVDLTGASRDLGAPAAPASASWADDPSAWRSGGDAARDDIGEGIGAVPSPDDAGPTRALEVAPPPSTVDALPPTLLSRSALAFPAAGGLESADRDLAPQDPNPERYGDAGPGRGGG